MTARWYSIRAAASGAEVVIYDAIGGPDGISAKAFVADLRKHASAKQLTIRINSPGGSVFDAVAIYNALARHPAHKTVWVDGFAASAASVVAMAGDEIIMPDNTIMMIHEPYGAALGTAADMRAMAEALDRAGDALVVAYRRSRQTDSKIRALLTAETWMSAREAVDLGFADRVADPIKIAACADFGSFPYKHAPQPSPADAWSKVLTSKFPKVAGQTPAGAPPELGELASFLGRHLTARLLARMPTMLDLGDDDHPAVPLVAVRFDGELGEPLVVVPAAVLSPDDAVTYARRIFDAAASACRRSRLDVAGRC